MFGGFSSSFYDEYHSHLPKSEPAEDFNERLKLYQLFHYLNHTVLFGVSLTFPTLINFSLKSAPQLEWIRRPIHVLGEPTPKVTPNVRLKRVELHGEFVFDVRGETE